MDAKPIVKWAGGKRQLLSKIRRMIPADFGCYFEPFLGGGAVLFALQPRNAVVNDINQELINMYRVVRDNPSELVKLLKSYENSKEAYLNIRSWDRNAATYAMLSPLQRASRLIYLNKTCFNGLYRVNSKNQFNVPYANPSHPDIVNEKKIHAVSEYLCNNDVELCCYDFGEVLSNVETNDFVYLDPPYDPLSQTSSFTSYSSGGFDRDEQKRLKKCCDMINDRGAKFLLSNSSTEFIAELYKNYRIKTVKAKRAVNSDGEGRGEIDEVLVYNYDC